MPTNQFKGENTMNKNDQQFAAQKIRARYTEKESTELDALRALDAKVKRPADIFSYIFGSIGAVVMGGGMSLVMTDIGMTLGIANSMPVGIIVGILGMVLALINYPIHKRIMKVRKEKYAPEILAISEKIINQ